jgi:hypothetical protein
MFSELSPAFMAQANVKFTMKPKAQLNYTCTHNTFCLIPHQPAIYLASPPVVNVRRQDYLLASAAIPAPVVIKTVINQQLLAR